MAKRKTVPKNLVIVKGRKGNPAWTKGHVKVGGRKKGTPNKVVDFVAHRTAMFAAPELVGSDGQGKDGALGWYLKMIHKYPKIYLQALVRQMPLEVNATVRGTMTMIAAHVSEKDAAEAYNAMLEDLSPMPQLERSKDGSFAVAAPT